MARLLKIAALIAYFSVTVWLTTALTVSVYRSSREGMGKTLPPNAQVTAADLRACLDDLEALHAGLNERLGQVPVTGPGREQAAAWLRWTSTWRTRLRATASRCRLERDTPPEAAALREAWDEVEDLHWLYTTHVVQFSREIGERADRAREKLHAARTAVSPTPR